MYSCFYVLSVIFVVRLQLLILIAFYFYYLFSLPKHEHTLPAIEMKIFCTTRLNTIKIKNVPFPTKINFSKYGQQFDYQSCDIFVIVFLLCVKSRHRFTRVYISRDFQKFEAYDIHLNRYYHNINNFQLGQNLPCHVRFCSNIDSMSTINLVICEFRILLT